MPNFVHKHQLSKSGKIMRTRTTHEGNKSESTHARFGQQLRDAFGKQIENRNVFTMNTSESLTSQFWSKLSENLDENVLQSVTHLREKHSSETNKRSRLKARAALRFNLKKKKARRMQNTELHFTRRRCVFLPGHEIKSRGPVG